MMHKERDIVEQNALKKIPNCKIGIQFWFFLGFASFNLKKIISTVGLDSHQGLINPPLDRQSLEQGFAHSDFCLHT